MTVGYLNTLDQNSNFVILRCLFPNFNYSYLMAKPLLMRFALTIVFVFYCAQVCTQEFVSDSLSKLSDEELLSLFNEVDRDSVRAEVVARTYLDRAIEERDTIKMARGYERLAQISTYEKALKNLDNCIRLSENLTNGNYPTACYLFKAYYQFQNLNYENSLDDALAGYRYAKQRDDIGYQISALQYISAINSHWGDFREALKTQFLTRSLMLDTVNRENYKHEYIATCENIGICYIRLMKPDSALYFFKEGIERSLAIRDTISYNDFVAKTGFSLYFMKKYQAAQDSIIKGYRNNRISKRFMYHFYLGSIHYDQNDRFSGMKHFRMVDSIYNREDKLYPELGVLYYKMSSYYKEKGDFANQLLYLNKLLAVDSLMDRREAYIKNRVEQSYIRLNLLDEKENLISKLEKKNRNSSLTILSSLFFLGLSIIVLLYYFGKQRLYKKRFEKLISQEKNSRHINKTLRRNQISSQVIQNILNHLDEFEELKNFLSTGVSLNTLAKSFGTNPRYLSNVINLEKNKNFSNYINDLRVEYAFEELKFNSTFRKYTIKAIAGECGFKNAESFSKCFYRKHGIYPSYYIKQLEKRS